MFMMIYPKECGELLTDSLCIRQEKHRPPHSSERRYAELLDERDQLENELESALNALGRSYF